MLKPAIFLVTTLGLIGTWQVFDQIYVMGKGAPAGTTMTPAFLSYNQSFRSFKYGSGAAMAFVVFLIIVVLTWLQRRLLDEERVPRRVRRARAVQRGAEPPNQGVAENTVAALQEVDR
jgi:multiple sugar transport system permease protein